MILLDADPLLSFGGIDSQSGMLTDILGAFTRFIDQGGQKVVDAEAKLAAALLAIQLLRLIVEVGLSRSAMARSFITFVSAALWYKVATNAVDAAGAYTSWMGSLGTFFGATAAGGGMAGSENIMANPSLFTTLGFKALKLLLDQAMEFSPLTAIVALGLYTIVGLFVLICFVALGIIVVFTVVRSSIEVILGLALIPFVIEDHLRFLAAKGLGLIADAGITLGSTSVAVGVAYGFLANIHLQPTPTIRDGLNLAIAAVCLAIVSGGAALIKTGAGVAIGAMGGGG